MYLTEWIIIMRDCLSPYDDHGRDPSDHLRHLGQSLFLLSGLRDNGGYKVLGIPREPSLVGCRCPTMSEYRFHFSHTNAHFQSDHLPHYLYLPPSVSSRRSHEEGLKGHRGCYSKELHVKQDIGSIFARLASSWRPVCDLVDFSPL